MPVAVAATWRAQPGQEEHVRRALEQVTQASRREPGCLCYIPHRSATDPQLFYLYEQYRDEAAFEEHKASDHFREHVLDETIPRLEHRSIEILTTFENDPPLP